MQKIIAYVGKFYLLLILLALIPAAFFYQASQQFPSVVVAKLLGLLECGITGAITFFLFYAFFRVAGRLFGAKFVLAFSSIGIVIFLISYLFSLITALFTSGNVSAVLAVSALLGIVKYRNYLADTE